MNTDAATSRVQSPFEQPGPQRTPVKSPTTNDQGRVDAPNTLVKAMDPKPVGFEELGLKKEVLQSLVEAGYKTPSPIQAQTIPHVLAGCDVLGQAVTGSGKTAAFACPLLSRIELEGLQPQVLVLTPTRELAIQVTDAIKAYAKHLPGFRAVTVYGGQSYEPQLRQLRQGVHIVVGTPGRVMDHMRRRTLSLNNLKSLVLDEADEMLRMGFVDDVEWVLTQTPQERQVLLFSATLPEPIRRIASAHLKDPKQVTVAGRNATAESIEQHYVVASAKEKKFALTRILEAENVDGVIVFARTRGKTVEIAEQLTAAGYSAAALNGDVPQSLRERTVDNFRKERLAILVATDVAARGLDVDRVSHVINYDFPDDVEAYVHRVGRTGRAGRSGQAITFVSHQEKGRLNRLQGATKQRLALMPIPSIAEIKARRIERFKERVVEGAQNDNQAFEGLVKDISEEFGLSTLQVAASLAKIMQGDSPLLVNEPTRAKAPARRTPDEPRDKARYERAPKRSDQRPNAKRPSVDAAPRPAPHSTPKPAPQIAPRSASKSAPQIASPTPVAKPPAATPKDTAHAASPTAQGDGDDSQFNLKRFPSQPRTPPGQHRYRVQVGRSHGAEAQGIIDAILSKSPLQRTDIGRIDLHALHSSVELPDELPADVIHILQGVRVEGQRLRLAKDDGTRGGRRPLPKKRPEALLAKGKKKPKAKLRKGKAVGARKPKRRDT
ncbi:MAG: DEAD/DEAH box helicase [Gammaproteobacteria bacterium]|nr:DEAD/DEAH box helicase [Gammaproteobacteria bacterium]